MKTKEYFFMMDEAIKEVASKADLLMFEGIISKKDFDSLCESVLTLSCFYTSYFNCKPPFLLEFLEKDHKEKLSAKEKKQLGAYFTPPYIAEYICKETIGPLVEKIIKDKSIKDNVKQICNLKICDPAMGGGIFLVMAHNFIMEKIIKIKPRKYSFSEMSKMSGKCLHGVDINPKAVEFSKLIINLNIAKWATLGEFKYKRELVSRD